MNVFQHFHKLSIFAKLCYHAGSNRGPSACKADVITTTPWCHGFNSIITVPHAWTKFCCVYAKRSTYPKTFSSQNFCHHAGSNCGLSACEEFLTIYFTPWWDHFNSNKIVANTWTKLCCVHASVQHIHKLSLRKTFVTTLAETADFLHVKNIWQFFLHHGEIISTATSQFLMHELSCCVHECLSTFP